MVAECLRTQGEWSMGSGIIARVFIVAGVCGAAYFGFVVAAPADSNVGASCDVLAVAQPIPGETVDATADALARLRQPVLPAPITGGNARLRALFEGFAANDIATGTETRVKPPASPARAGNSGNVRAKTMIRAGRYRITSPWNTFSDARRKQVSIFRNHPRMYEPFEGRYLFQFGEDGKGKYRPKDRPTNQSIKPTYRRVWWQ